MSRDLVFVSFSMFAWGLGEGLFLYFQPIYLQQLGADPIAIGAILGSVGLMMTISHVPAGYLADRLGRKPVMIVAWMLGVVATWIMALAKVLPVFTAGFLLYGFTLFVLSPLYSYITAARGRWSVARVITLISASFNMGAVIGPWLGGLIGDQLGLRQTYYLAAWIFMASTAIILFIRTQPVERPASGEDGNAWLLNPRHLAYLGAVFLAMFATYLPQPLSPNFLQNQRHLTLAQIGPLYSLSGVGVVVLNLLLGQLPARLGFLLGQAAVGLFALSLWLGTGLPWYMLGYFMLGGYKTTRLFATAQVRQLVHQTRMGLAYGLNETVNSTAMILAPVMAGYLYSRNPVGIYSLGVGLIVFSLIISARFSPLPQEKPLGLDETGVLASTTLIPTAWKDSESLDFKK